MSKSVALFIIIRDGQRRCYEDRWAFLYRELLWGAEDLETWLAQGEETDYEPEDLSGGVVINFDKRELIWCAGEGLEVPRVQAVHKQLMEQAWPDFQIRLVSESTLRAASLDSEHAEENDDLCERYETVREAAGLDDEDDEDDEDDDENDENDENDDDDDDENDDGYDDDLTRAWVTLLDKHGNARHRNLEQISADIINGDKAAVEQLAKFKAAEVPPEKAVTEGLWIDIKAKEIGLWGGTSALRDFPRLQHSWQKWSVRWAENGYADQCEASGLPGVKMSDTDALTTIVPNILSTKRFDFGAVLGAVGGQLKSTAMKATGCLLVVLSVPILIFGFFAEKMQAAGIAIAVLAAVVAIAFKVIESRLKAKFRNAPFNRDDPTNSRAPVAGPLDVDDRRRRLDQMLSTCGFPSIAELEPHFPEDASLDDVL